MKGKLKKLIVTSLALGLLLSPKVSFANSEISRGDFANEIANIFEAKEKSDLSMYKDIEEAKDFEGVSKAVYMGAIFGKTQDHMGVADGVTFEEAITSLYRIMAYTDGDISKLSEMENGNEVSQWAKIYVAKFIETGVIKDELLKIKPGSYISVETLNQIIENLFPNIVKSQEDLNNLKVGNVLVTKPVKIQGVKIQGDLVLADGLVGEKIQISNSEISQRVLVRGGNAQGAENVVDLVKEDALRGDANVDNRNYPVVDPFIHPPFYNARVRLYLDDAGKITLLEDDRTSDKGVDPTKTKAIWIAKNGKYWELASKEETFNKFIGKNLDEVKAMNMNSGEVDAVTGATESGRAIQEAVINAIEKKAGKKFLSPNEFLAAESIEIEPTVREIIFKNSLPKDFQVKLLNIKSTMYNGPEEVSADNYKFEQAGEDYKLTLEKELKPGKYFVNIIDESGTYRPVDFESGHGAPRRYAYFVVKSPENAKFENGKIVVPGNDLKNFVSNIEEIIIKDKSLIGTKVTVKGKEVDYEGVEVEPIGHHGTPDAYFEKAPLFLEDGSLNLASQGRIARKQTDLFQEGKSYVVILETYGYGDVEFEVDVPTKEVPKETPKTEVKKEAKKTEKIEKKGYAKNVSAPTNFDYSVKLKVEVDGSGKIVKVSNAGTDAGSSSSFFDKAMNGMSKKFVGKTAKDIDGLDVISGATETSKAMKIAVKKAF